MRSKKSVFLLFLEFLLCVAFPGAGFYFGYKQTELYFRTKLIPYPFEWYGIAVGLALFFWILAILNIIFGFAKKIKITRARVVPIIKQ